MATQPLHAPLECEPSYVRPPLPLQLKPLPAQGESQVWHFPHVRRIMDDIRQKQNHPMFPRPESVDDALAAHLAHMQDTLYAKIPGYPEYHQELNNLACRIATLLGGHDVTGARAAVTFLAEGRQSCTALTTQRGASSAAPSPPRPTSRPRPLGWARTRSPCLMLSATSTPWRSRSW